MLFGSRKKYGKRFHRRRLKHLQYGLMATASLNTAAYHPTLREYGSVFDVGCSLGPLLHEIQEQDPKLRIGATDFEVPQQSLQFEGRFYEHDLSRGPLAPEEEYDLVITQEVAEHIEQANESHILDTLHLAAAPDATLIFGAARVGQGGEHHVNCQDKPYWRERLEARGWVYEERMTWYYFKLCEQSAIVRWWYVENTMCFSRVGSGRPAG